VNPFELPQKCQPAPVVSQPSSLLKMAAATMSTAVGVAIGMFVAGVLLMITARLWIAVEVQMLRDNMSKAMQVGKK
jgi:hypothetical protein